MMPTNIDLVRSIRDSPQLLGIPHSKCDCQAAVEKALALVGIQVNYRGSNHMWRDMVHDRSWIYDYRAKHGKLTPGLICFTLKNDGSEKNRGYYDDMGAAVHVGIILDNDSCFQSASRGTEICSLSKTTFNQVAYCNLLEYIDIPAEEPQENVIMTLLTEIRNKLDTISNMIGGSDNNGERT